MNERDADKALRALFQEAGQFTAPEGLDARILQRIAVIPRATIAIDKPLLPKWVWALSAVLLTGLAFLPGGSGNTSWTSQMPSFDPGNVFSSPWLLMGLATCAALLGLDAWLNTRRTAVRSR